MAVYNSYVVEYKHGSTWYAISNVQAIQCSVGRTNPTDQWPVSTTTMRVWYPEGYDSPITNLRLGTKIRFFCPGRSSTKPTWTGYVSDLAIEIGIPWNSATADGNADFLIIECEGELGRMGRVGVLRNASSGTVAIGGNGNQYQSTFKRFYPLDGSFVEVPFVTTAGECYMKGGAFNSSGGADFEASETPQTTAQRFATHIYGRLCDGVRKPSTTGLWASTDGVVDDPALYLATEPITSTEIATVSFSDVNNDATRRAYDAFDFDSAADNNVNQSTISFIAYGTPDIVSTVSEQALVPEGFVSAYNANAIRADETGTPYVSSEDWRTMIAMLYANIWNDIEIRPSAISATTADQHTQNLDTLGFTDLELGYLPAKAVWVTLRGDNYLCRIEGVQLSADLNQSRFTYYLTSAQETAWFILDSADLGVLNTNKLGLY